MNLDPRSLQIFRAVCLEKSISSAARTLNVSQPSVSVAMSRLEDTVGSKLFERHRSGIKLTREGEVLKRHAMAMDNLLNAAARDLTLSKADVAGSIIVGGTPGALASLMPTLLRSVIQEVPRFQMQMLEMPDTDLEAKLRNRDIDIAVATAGTRARPDDIQELSLIRDPFSLIVGRENAHLPDRVALRDLSEARWIMPHASGAFSRQVSALFLSAGITPPHNVLRSDSLLATKAIIRVTDYITILPRRVAATELQANSLRALDIEDIAIEREVGMLWLKGQSLSRLATLFIANAKRLEAV